MPVPMERCPRYQRCSAPLCPLDPDLPRRVALKGDPVCSLTWPQVEALAPGISYAATVKTILDRGGVVPSAWRRTRREAV